MITSSFIGLIYFFGPLSYHLKINPRKNIFEFTILDFFTSWESGWFYLLGLRMEFEKYTLRLFQIGGLDTNGKRNEERGMAEDV